jgi:Protein of unknown function (DUF2442)
MSSSTVEIRETVATRVEVSDDTLSVELADGRTIAAPLAWYPRLAHATTEERGTWRLIGGGIGVHWPKIDEDISVANLLAGQPSMESQSSFKKWLASRAKPGPSTTQSRVSGPSPHSAPEAPMRIIDNPAWVRAIHAGVTALQAKHAPRGWFDSHNLINWLNRHHNAVLNAIVDNYRTTGKGKPAKNPVHTATREIGRFIERRLGQVKTGDHQSVRNPIKLTDGGVHPGDECENSVWKIDASTTGEAQHGG